MAANPNWPRWLFASISDHFKTICDDNDLPLLIEGIEDRTSDKVRIADRAELRINGPIINEVSINYFRVLVSVNILLLSYMTQENRYDLIQNCGVILAGMTTIPIYKAGNGPDDDGSLIGCLEVRDDLNQGYAVHHFGQLKPDVQIRESIVTGNFKMFLTN